MIKKIKLFLIIGLLAVCADMGFSTDLTNMNFSFDKIKLVHERATRAFNRPHDNRYDFKYRAGLRDYQRARGNCRSRTGSYCSRYCKNGIKSYKDFLAIIRYRHTHADAAQAQQFATRYKTRASEVLRALRRGGQRVKSIRMINFGLGIYNLGRTKFSRREYKEAVKKFESSAGFFWNFIKAQR